MPAWKISEWMAYAELEPFGQGRADYRAGLLASVFANANREEYSDPVQPEDFFPNLLEEAEEEAYEESWERIKHVMNGMMVAQ
jgi:hypothetical protein